MEIEVKEEKCLNVASKKEELQTQEQKRKGNLLEKKTEKSMCWGESALGF